MKTQDFRCINEVRTKNQRDVKCLAYLVTINQGKVIIRCRRCKQDYVIVGENLEIKKLVNNDIRINLNLEVV